MLTDFAVGVIDGHPHAGGADADLGVAEDLPGLVDHLHFLVGVAVIVEVFDVGQHVEGDLVRIDIDLDVAGFQHRLATG